MNYGYPAVGFSANKISHMLHYSKVQRSAKQHNRIAATLIKQRTKPSFQ